MGAICRSKDMKRAGTKFWWRGKIIPRIEIPPLRLYKYVAPGFFATAGTRLIAGREQTWSELYEMLPIVMVSDGLARELLGIGAGCDGETGA